MLTCWKISIFYDRNKISFCSVDYKSCFLCQIVLTVQIYFLQTWLLNKIVILKNLLCLVGKRFCLCLAVDIWWLKIPYLPALRTFLPQGCTTILTKKFKKKFFRKVKKTKVHNLILYKVRKGDFWYVGCRVIRIFFTYFCGWKEE